VERLGIAFLLISLLYIYKSGGINMERFKDTFITEIVVEILVYILGVGQAAGVE